MSNESKTQDWSKPAAMAIPKGGYFQDKVEQGRYGPIFPKTPDAGPLQTSGARRGAAV